jgi:hypothetical protein
MMGLQESAWHLVCVCVCVCVCVFVRTMKLTIEVCVLKFVCCLLQDCPICHKEVTLSAGNDKGTAAA